MKYSLSLWSISTLLSPGGAGTARTAGRIVFQHYCLDLTFTNLFSCNDSTATGVMSSIFHLKHFHFHLYKFDLSFVFLTFLTSGIRVLITIFMTANSNTGVSPGTVDFLLMMDDI